MDPLSLTASIISIVGIGGQAAKAVRKIASLKGAPDIVLSLNNEIADLHLVVLAIQDVFQKQQTSGKALPSHRQNEIHINASITSSLNEANETAVQLNTLYRRLSTSAAGSSSTTLNKVAWLREQKRVRQVQEDLRNVRLKLGAALGILNSAILLRLEPDIQDISTKIRDLYTMQSQIDTAQIQRSIRQEVAVQSLSDDIKDLQACQQLIEAQHQQRSTRYESMFREPLTQLFMAQERLELKLDVLEASYTIAKLSRCPHHSLVGDAQLNVSVSAIGGATRAARVFRIGFWVLCLSDTLVFRIYHYHATPRTVFKGHIQHL
ncbi:hypothetical protein MMC14_005586 [Varicellaria rhodocarpa]|nr:hypothetical protein [Varicellaria rhodocarpa]